MSRSEVRGVCLLAVVVALAWPPVGAHAGDAPPRDSSRATVVEIEEALVCQCGCGLTVHACNHLNCPSGIPMKEEIRKRLARGETKEQIITYFRDRYGEKVLSAPTLSGFNLLAWTAPYTALLIGAVLMALVVRRWARNTAGVRPRVKTSGSAADDEYRERLAREMSEYDG